MSKKRIVIAAAILLAAAGFVFVLHPASSSAAEKADAIIEACAQQKDHSACYERLVPALYPAQTVPQIFDVVRSIRQKDASYQFCHVLAHKIGERVVSEDPSKWVNAVPLNPTDGFCSNGFIHGIISGRFSAEVLDEATIESLLPDFRRACEPHDGWDPSDLDKAMCYHAMGHLYDYITDADLDHALTLCEQTTTEQFHRVCREGVFMQIYQPLEPDDYALIARMPSKPTPSTVRQFCAQFKKDEYEGACLRESWPMHAGMTDGTGVTSFCSGQPNADEETACYESATAIIGRMSLDSPEKAASACEKLLTKWQQMCFVTVAQTVIEENRLDADKAIALCKRADPQAAEGCMRDLAMRASFLFGENMAQLQHFCAALPADIRGECGAVSQRQ